MSSGEYENTQDTMDRASEGAAKPQANNTRIASIVHAVAKQREQTVVNDQWSRS